MKVNVLYFSFPIHNIRNVSYVLSRNRLLILHFLSPLRFLLSPVVLKRRTEGGRPRVVVRRRRSSNSWPAAVRWRTRTFCGCWTGCAPAIVRRNGAWRRRNGCCWRSTTSWSGRRCCWSRRPPQRLPGREELRRGGIRLNEGEPVKVVVVEQWRWQWPEKRTRVRFRSAALRQFWCQRTKLNFHCYWRLSEATGWRSFCGERSSGRMRRKEEEEVKRV